MDFILQIAAGVFVGNIAALLFFLSMKRLWHVENADDAPWGALAAGLGPLVFIGAILLANFLRAS